MLTERKKIILKAIVDDYVLSAEPVGSKVLVEKHNLGISSATVRNEMSELEELGYLEKTHLSSGRIPSDMGYRAYIDDMLNLKPLSEKDQEKIEGFFSEHMNEVTGLVQQTANALSEQTNFPSMVISPKYGDTNLEQIKILMIEPGKALVVVVLSPGIVKDRLVRIPTAIDQNDLALISNLIEHKLSGKRLDQITLITVNAAAEELPVPENILNQVLFEAYISIKQAENIDFFIKGSHKLLEQPEFQEVNTAKRFLDTIHQNGLVAGYMSELQDDETIEGTEKPSYMVRIGQEIALEGLKDCSFITATYRISNKITGRIGVVGPKRMAYDKIISQINFVNYTLDKQLLELAAGYDMKEKQNGEE